MFRVSVLLCVILVVGRTNFVDSVPAITGPNLNLVAIRPKVGTVSTDQDISVLAVLDQNGADDNWNSYIEATPSPTAKIYNIEFDFERPWPCSVRCSRRSRRRRRGRR